MTTLREFPEHVEADQADLRAALRAAQEKGWKLTPREWSGAILSGGDLTDAAAQRMIWQAMHDTSPSVGKEE